MQTNMKAIFVLLFEGFALHLLDIIADYQLLTTWYFEKKPVAHYIDHFFLSKHISWDHVVEINRNSTVVEDE